MAGQQIQANIEKGDISWTSVKDNEFGIKPEIVSIILNQIIGTGLARESET